ncbi:S-layer homology domain-containing protein [Paenibacillus elgii]|uniref:S-layer homology domain-containing protein n=1 Tax=Paenibacillus elgii TaxID=189691 RepID=UPI00203E29EA|nr:S-layer homology domain-containing protein [Paenibacillus elgii]MCM3271031.1 S-layer homology domain-containing protein [Paenibacillus elgii]
MCHKKKSKALTVVLGALLLFNVMSVGASANGSEFKDVSQDHWGYETISWAKENGIVDGYLDGTFKPEQSVGQTEFLAMLIRAYKPKGFSEQSSDSDWRTPYIQYGFKMGWGGSYIVPPASKLSSSTKSEISEPRMYVAKLITNANGRNYSFDDSIRFLLDSGLSKGKTDNTVAGFKGNELLTRAEAVTFIRNVKSKLNMLYPSPERETAYDPKTLTFSPFEAFPLIVVQPDKYGPFSHITLTTPSAGYTLIHDPSYTISGTVQKAVGEELITTMEYWDNGEFISEKSLKTSITKGDFKTTLELSKPGIFRIVIYSKQENPPTDTPITTFYVEYKSK